MGMVKVPVEYTLAAATPLMEPKSPELITAILAGPPRPLPARRG